MPSESQKDEICIVPSNATRPTTPTPSDMLSAAFQKQATVGDSSNYNNTITTSTSTTSNSSSNTVSPTTPTHRTTPHRKQQSHDPTRLRPSQLATMLKDDHYAAVTTTTSRTTAFTRRNSANHGVDQPLMIDVRDYEDYEKQRIRNSINVNLPTLLIKRYRRGTVSNFNLESFIATEEGKQYYLSWLRRFTSSTSISTTTATTTANPHSYRRIIVYDDTMQDMDSHAWILVNVMKSKLPQQQFKIYTLDGGFNAFMKWDAWAAYLTGFVYNTTSFAPAPSTSSSWAPWDTPSHTGEAESVGNGIGNVDIGGGTTKANKLSVMPATPTQSRSATTFSSGSSAWMNPIDTNVQRRASLFSLDTSTAREKFHNRQHRFRHNKDPHVKPSRSRGLMKSNGSSTTTNTNATTDTTTTPMITQYNINDNNNNNNQYQHPLHQEQHDLSSISESSMIMQDINQQQPRCDMDQVEEEEEMMMTAPTDTALWSDGGGTPSSEGNHAFIISEIVPGFLYLGPEISTEEQLFKLQSRSIKQILNMAEECDDDVPGLKDQIKYHKVAAQDTVIMQNVEKTLKRAVQVIDQAKNKHEPIYVHCKAGKSRSVAAILAYFVLSEKWTLKRAYQHVIKARPSMSPNIGFVAELLKLEKSIHGQVSNFGAPNWQSVDPSIPPSPESQKAIGKVELAWSSPTATVTSGKV